MAAPALPRGRGGAAAPSERGGSHGQGQPVAHEPVSRVPRGADTEASQEGAVRRDRKGGRRDARDAGRRRDGGGGAPAPTTHAPAPGLRPSTARATWWVGRGAGARPCRASGTMSGGALAGRDPTMWARGHHAGTVGLSEPAAGRHVRRKPDGSRTGWRECPRRGPDGSGHRPVAAMPLS